MEIHTNRLICISIALKNLLLDAEFSINRYLEGMPMESAFLKTYMRIREGKPGRDNINCEQVLNIKPLEDELRDNFLRLNEELRSNYVRFLDISLLSIFEKAKEIELKFSKLNDRIKKREIDSNERIIDTHYQNFTIQTFVNSLSTTLAIVQDVQSIYVLYVGSNHYSANLDESQKSTLPGVKLQWNCKPAIAGFIISELIRAGYLEPPKTNGEMSLTKLANICNQVFEVRDHTPSNSSWRNVVDPDRNTLPDIKRAKLKLPDLDQLT